MCEKKFVRNKYSISLSIRWSFSLDRYSCIRYLAIPIFLGVSFDILKYDVCQCFIDGHVTYRRNGIIYERKFRLII